MARSRNIKPSIFKNEVLGTADPFLTILFAGLWCLADREGRLEDRPLRIGAEIFPYRLFSFERINGYLTELVSLDFIQRYKVGDEAVIQVLKFKKHQSPHNTEKASELPEKSADSPVNIGVTVKDSLDHGEVTEAKRPDSFNLIPDLLIPDSPKPEKPKDAFASQAEEIFEHWQTQLHPNAKFIKIRKTKVLARLAEKYSVEQIKLAIDNCKASEYHVTNGFTDLELICRDGVKLDAFINRKPTGANNGTNQKSTATGEELDRETAEFLRSIGSNGQV